MRGNIVSLGRTREIYTWKQVNRYFRFCFQIENVDIFDNSRHNFENANAANPVYVIGYWLHKSSSFSEFVLPLNYTMLGNSLWIESSWKDLHVRVCASTSCFYVCLYVLQCTRRRDPPTHTFVRPSTDSKRWWRRVPTFECRSLCYFERSCSTRGTTRVP